MGIVIVDKVSLKSNATDIHYIPLIPLSYNTENYHFNTHTKNNYSNNISANIQTHQTSIGHPHGIFFDIPDPTLDLIVIIPLGILLFTFCILTIFGNFMVIYVIKKDRKLQTVSNYFIMSLASADLLLGLLVMPISIVYLLSNKWVFGMAFCKIWLSIDYTASTASIFNLFILSLDRYWSIISPLRYLKKRTKNRAMSMIGPVWLISATWIIPIVWWNTIDKSLHGAKDSRSLNMRSTSFIVECKNFSSKCHINKFNNPISNLNFNVTYLNYSHINLYPNHTHLSIYSSSYSILDVLNYYVRNSSSLNRFIYSDSHGKTNKSYSECNVEFANVMALKIITALINFYIPAILMLALYWKIFFEIKKRSAIELKLTNNPGNMSDRIMDDFSKRRKENHYNSSMKDGYSLSSISSRSQLGSFKHKLHSLYNSPTRKRKNRMIPQLMPRSLDEENWDEKNSPKILDNTFTTRIDLPLCNFEKEVKSITQFTDQTKYDSKNILTPKVGNGSENSFGLFKSRITHKSKSPIEKNSDYNCDISHKIFNRIILEEVKYDKVSSHDIEKACHEKIDDFGPVKIFIKYVDTNKKNEYDTKLSKMNNNEADDVSKLISFNQSKVCNGKVIALNDPTCHEYDLNRTYRNQKAQIKSNLKNIPHIISKKSIVNCYKNLNNHSKHNNISKIGCRGKNLLSFKKDTNIFSNNPSLWKNYTIKNDFRWNRSPAMTNLLDKKLKIYQQNAKKRKSNGLISSRKLLMNRVRDGKHSTYSNSFTFPPVDFSKSLTSRDRYANNMTTLKTIHDDQHLKNMCTSQLNKSLVDPYLFGRASSNRNLSKTHLNYLKPTASCNSDPRKHSYTTKLAHRLRRIKNKTLKSYTKVSESFTNLLPYNPRHLNSTLQRIPVKTGRSNKGRILFKEKKAAKQLGVIMGAFIICWLPYFIVFMIIPFCEGCVSNNVQITFTWLGYLNSTVNPFLYAMCNSKFKNAFQHIFMKTKTKRPKIKKLSLTLNKSRYK
ncbi:unnamed protein product [Gordionus sp. m RMFG-2023]